jgi:hypothetical protein
MRACAVFITLAIAAPASAQESEFPTARLEWRAPRECIPAAELRAAVTTRMERAAFGEEEIEDAELIVRGRVSRSGDRYGASIVLSTRDGEPLGERSLESDSEDCRSLDDALAVMLSILLNVRREDLPVRAAPPVSWTFHARAGAGAIVGFLPEPGLEAIVGAGAILPGAISLELELAYFYGDRVRAMEGEMRAQGGSARVVVAPILYYGEPFELALRLAVGAGPMWARGYGFHRDLSAVRFFLEVRAGVRASVRVAGPFFVGIAADLGIIPVRPTFVVSNGDGRTMSLFEPTLFLGSFFLELGLRTG